MAKEQRKEGYQEAKEIVNKKFIMGIGGRSVKHLPLFFNAIDLAGLEIVERYTHSREIGYVKTGRDATVSRKRGEVRF
ncbi:VanW family protein [Anaerobacillus sp. HL2]|nr:VanW family protein [Anaerobacillus sp. HL2]